MPDGVVIPGGPSFGGSPQPEPVPCVPGPSFDGFMSVPGGPDFAGNPQPPDVPCDPVGDAWRGEPGPPGPAGPPGPSGAGYILPTASTTVLGGVMVDGTSIAISGGVISSSAAAAGVSSWNTRSGAVTLTNADVVAVLPASSTMPGMDGTAAIGTGTTWARSDHVHPVDTSRYAASNPAGYVTAAAAASAAPVQSVATRTGAITLTHTDITDWTATLAPYALLASPSFTGTPTLPTGTTGITQTAGTSNTTLATTAFVGAAITAGSYALPTASTTVLGGVKIDGTSVTIASGTISAALPIASSTLPNMDGTATIGVGTTWARADHIHPTDTSRAPTASPTFTGTVTAGAANVGALTATGITGSPISGSTGSFTTLAASSTVSGTGFSTYLASPPAIGGTVAAAGAFTTLSATSTTTLATTNVGTGGLHFGSVYASTRTDLTRHLDIYGGATGFNTTSTGDLNLVSAAAIVFMSATTNSGYINASGANIPIGQQTAYPGSFSTLSATGTTTLAGMTSTGITGSPISGSTGSFTTLAASSTVSGAGFSTYLASPPAIGGTAAAAGAFTTLSATSAATLSGGGTFTGTYAGTHTYSGAVTFSSTIAGAALTTYLASPAAIGGTAAAAGTFTTLTASAQILSLPAAKGGTSYSVGATDRSLILQPTGTFTLTLPTASASAGRILVLKLIAAFAVNSASSNVVPMAGGSAAAAILAATAGKYAELQSDGSNWQIMSAN